VPVLGPCGCWFFTLEKKEGSPRKEGWIMRGDRCWKIVSKFGHDTKGGFGPPTKPITSFVFWVFCFFPGSAVTLHGKRTKLVRKFPLFGQVGLQKGKGKKFFFLFPPIFFCLFVRWCEKPPFFFFFLVCLSWLVFCFFCLFFFFFCSNSEPKNTKKKKGGKFKDQWDLFSKKQTPSRARKKGGGETLGGS